MVKAGQLVQLDELWLEKMGFKVGEQLELLDAIQAFDEDHINEVARRCRAAAESEHQQEHGQREQAPTRAGGGGAASIGERLGAQLGALAHQDWVFGDGDKPEV